MRALLLLPLLFLPACSVFGGTSTLESSVMLQPGETTTLTLHAAQPSAVSVDLRGMGPGGVAFDARASSGKAMARGLLTTESTATCRASDGDLTITFTADARGGAVGYVVSTANGVALTAAPEPR